MKTVTVVVICSCMLVCCGAVMANLYGSDDFNDNVMDSSKWSVMLGDSLSETNNRLEYAGGSGESVGAWNWELNKGSYVHDWRMSIDVVNSVDETALSNQKVEFGFMAWNVSPYDNSFSVEFLVGDEASGSSPYRSIVTDAEHEHTQVLCHGTPLSADSIRLQISFDAATKVFTSYYDSGGGMIVLTNYNIGAWGMSDSDEFTIAVFGVSEDVSPASGEVFGDNFEAIPEPGTLGLLGAGIGGLLLTRRKHTDRFPSAEDLRNDRSGGAS